MLVKNEIILHDKSVKYMKAAFSQYEEVSEPFYTVENPMLHLYPIEDTYNNSGDLDGYMDALFFKLHIYDPINLIVYKSNKRFDGIIPFDKLRVSQIKIFKDLSTMIVLYGKYSLSYNQGFSIGKVN